MSSELLDDICFLKIAFLFPFLKNESTETNLAKKPVDNWELYYKLRTNTILLNFITIIS